MIISDKYNFIIFAIPHTGSSSTQRILEPYGWCSFSEENHLTPDYVRAHVKIRGYPNWDKYYKVTTEQWMIDAVAEREKFVIEKFSYEYGKDGDRWR